MKIQTARWNAKQPDARVLDFLARPAVPPEAEARAREIVEDVRARGDAAVAEYARKLDGCALTPRDFAVTAPERAAAAEVVDVEFKRHAAEAHERIMRFARAGRRQDWAISAPRGGTLGEMFVPLDRVGVYVPAGAAPLASSALMTVTLARAADVAQIVACTPCDASGRVHPCILYALDLAGATEIYRIGGAHAIAAMAFGTETLRPVRKIVGPGGPYVTAAKRLVYGAVDIDMLAGPSEIAVLADDTAPARFVAADLLSQAEHGTGWERALLVTPSAELIRQVEAELVRQSGLLSRQETVKKVLEEGTFLVQVDNLDQGMDLCNRFAPEHLELLVAEPLRWTRKVRTAGAVFAGPWTPESAGDFVAGPSHVLPTGGTAAFFSGLSVESFRRRLSLVSFTRADLEETLPVIRSFGRVEALDAHSRSATIRFEPT